MTDRLIHFRHAHRPATLADLNRLADVVNVVMDRLDALEADRDDVDEQAELARGGWMSSAVDAATPRIADDLTKWMDAWRTDIARSGLVDKLRRATKPTEKAAEATEDAEGRPVPESVIQAILGAQGWTIPRGVPPVDSPSRAEARRIARAAIDAWEADRRAR